MFPQWENHWGKVLCWRPHPVVEWERDESPKRLPWDLHSSVHCRNLHFVSLSDPLLLVLGNTKPEANRTLTKRRTYGPYQGKTETWAPRNILSHSASHLDYPQKHVYFLKETPEKEKPSVKNRILRPNVYCLSIYH